MIDNMSLQEMQTYRGRHEVPSDFDEFWQAELDRLPELPNYRLVEQDFALPSATCYELWFDGTNGGQVFAKCIFPKTDKKVPVLFYFHGYQGQSPDWTESLKFVAAGYGVVYMDVRGQAGRSVDHGQFDGMTVKGQVIRGALEGPHKLFYKDIYLDVYQLVNIIAAQEFVDDSTLVSYGASQGGALALVAAALNPKITKTASIYPFLSDFKRILELGDNSEPYNELFRYFKFSDPFHETEHDFLANLSYIDIKNLAHRITCPVAFVVGLEDEICSPSTQFAIYNRLPCQKEMKILPEYGHEALNVKVNDYIYDFIFGSRIIRR
ncbi:acetylxylan esterase [Streptococcus sp. E24BD]|uniref:acetylxylan esterase n=1 Tax=Streptococcus sp. E24BD TaxID=3278715 RepID=UPI00359D95EF